MALRQYAAAVMARREHFAIEFEAHARAAAAQIAGDVDFEAMSVVFNVIRVANRIQQDLETLVYRPAGVTGASFRVLFALRAMGPLAPKDIAHLSSVSSASVSSVLNTLERNGFIERAKAGDDGRMITVALTGDGDAIVSDLFVHQNAREREWSSPLTVGERHMFAELLRKLLAFRPAHADGVDEDVSSTGA